ncbi:serine/threonine protein kinase [Thermobifida halotolerans]|uniref:Serine/threonine protein kinase n=2 Tax=Thermobifida halotolerans TaxID=483545 RepID=A0AA97LXT6_9ACTN|nr:serine/threonine-protein kinase [Thermobifida halotolerans]UOE19816.1 serine/threonine protein kinase [Thermobifida halotolerans]
MAFPGEPATVPYVATTDTGYGEKPGPVQTEKYRITGRIGSGGAAVVYAARGPAEERVAVKALRPETAADPAHRERFAREAALLDRVDARRTAAPIDADLHARRPWLAMRHVLGPTVGDSVDADGPMAGVNLVDFTARLAEALADIHRSGIVHRDLKPGNVLLAEDGPRVIDFGIARTVDEPADTDSGEILGSPGWISPEQFRNRVPGPPADVFAWGGLVAYAATGRRPFGSGAVRDTALRVLNGQADLRGVPRSLLPWVQAALDADPDRRPSAAELAAAIGGLAVGRTRSCGAVSRPRTAPPSRSAVRTQPVAPFRRQTPGRAPRRVQRADRRE